MRNSLFKLSVVILLLTVSSCALYREPAGAPELGLRNEWAGGKEDFVTGPVPAAAWWERFDDPVLNALVAQALQKNADVREALANVDAARALLGLERWEYMPSGGLAVSGEKRRYSDAEGQGSGTRETYRSGITASWELDLFGRVRNRNRVAQAGLLSAEATASAARLLVVSEVSATYHRARAASNRSKIRQQALAHQQSVVELTRFLVQEQREAGDVLDRALAEQAADEVALLREQEQLKILEHRMAVLLGLQAGQWRLPAETTAAALRLELISIGDVSAVLRTRPDIRIAEQTLIARQASVGIVRADYFPRLTLSGFFGFAAGSGGDLGEDGTESWFLGPALSWNALDLGRTGNRVEAGESRVDAASAAYERTVSRAIEETENAFLRFGTAHRELGLRDTRYRHARAAADAAQARYEEGLGSYLEALIARRDALAAEIGRVDGIAGHRLATVEVFKSLGVGS